MAPKPLRSRRRVLVVDDESVYRTAVAEFLAEEGYHVMAVRDGVAALDVLERFPPDVILLDGQMPRLDGVNFLRRYHRLAGEHAPVIFCSSHAIDPAAANLGVQAVVPKPCDLDIMLEAVRHATASPHPLERRWHADEWNDATPSASPTGLSRATLRN